MSESQRWQEKLAQLLQAEEETKQALYLVSEVIGRLSATGEAPAAETMQTAYNFIFRGGQSIESAKQLLEGLINAEIQKEKI